MDNSTISPAYIRNEGRQPHKYRIRHSLSDGSKPDQQQCVDHPKAGPQTAADGLQKTTGMIR
ncbi:MAG: hypothetical protein ACLVJ6_03695 [Merdibacter sp.]